MKRDLCHLGVFFVPHDRHTFLQRACFWFQFSSSPDESDVYGKWLIRSALHWTGILTRMFEKKKNDPPGQSLVPIQLETPIETLAAAEERCDSKGGIE